MSKTEQDPWQDATFAGARRAQVREAVRRTTAWERIRWACDMSEAVRLRQAAKVSNTPCLINGTPAGRGTTR